VMVSVPATGTVVDVTVAVVLSDDVRVSAPAACVVVDEVVAVVLSDATNKS